MSAIANAVAGYEVVYAKAVNPDLPMATIDQYIDTLKPMSAGALVALVKQLGFHVRPRSKRHSLEMVKLRIVGRVENAGLIAFGNL